MANTKKFAYIKNASTFTESLKEEFKNSIVFIEETGTIWTHKKEFSVGKSYVDQEIETLSQLIPTKTSQLENDSGFITSGGSSGDTIPIIVAPDGKLLTYYAMVENASDFLSWVCEKLLSLEVKPFVIFGYENTQKNILKMLLVENPRFDAQTEELSFSIKHMVSGEIRLVVYRGPIDGVLVHEVINLSSIEGKASLNSPSFSGTPTAPTPASSGDNSTRIATTAFVQSNKPSPSQLRKVYSATFSDDLYTLMYGDNAQWLWTKFVTGSGNSAVLSCEQLSVKDVDNITTQIFAISFSQNTLLLAIQDELFILTKSGSTYKITPYKEELIKRSEATNYFIGTREIAQGQDITGSKLGDIYYVT